MWKSSGLKKALTECTCWQLVSAFDVPRRFGSPVGLVKFMLKMETLSSAANNIGLDEPARFMMITERSAGQVR